LSTCDCWIVNVQRI